MGFPDGNACGEVFGTGPGGLGVWPQGHEQTFIKKGKKQEKKAT
jgi:hypothetical protein